MGVSARRAGLIAALVPLAAVVFGAAVIELIPRMIVGGVLVFLGLSFMVEWVWDRRRSLPPIEYGVVLVILAVIIGRGFLPGVVIGLVLAVVLFAVSYGRIELVREVAFGETYHSNVDRPADQRAVLRAMGDRVQILRVNGFVFFGSANSLLERIRKRVEAEPPRFLVIDLRRVTGVDSSAVVSFVKVVHLAEAAGFELVFTGTSDRCAGSWRAAAWSRPRGSCGSSRTWTAACSGARRVCCGSGSRRRRRRGRRRRVGATGCPGRGTRSPACPPACGPTSNGWSSPMAPC